MRTLRPWVRLGSRAGWAPDAPFGVCLVLEIAALAIDMSLPAEYAVGILYIAIMLASFWLHSRRSIVALAILSTGAAVLGYVISPESPMWDTEKTIFNRALVIAAIWCIFWLSLKHQSSLAALRQTASALHAQEARLRSIVDTVPESLITIDERGIVKSFSRSAEILFGYLAEEVIGKNISLLMPQPYKTEHDAYLARYIATGEKKIIGIGRVVRAERKDGTVFPIELSVGEAALPNGKRLFTGFIRDLTAKERMEQDLRQAQKMEAVGQLTGGIAHDFNNLLTVILGNLEMLEARLDCDERQRELLREIRETAALGARLTDRLLAFGRRQPLAPKITDIGQLIADMSDLLQRTLGEAIEVRTVAAKRDSYSHVDPGQLQNAILNLALNARDAMPDGGTLTIEVQSKDLDADYAQMHMEARAGRYVVVAVSDTGKGMPPEVQERAFEPFFTTKAVGAGSGLGLSMVYGFVKQSGGQVQLYSEEGHGTTVRLFLPLAATESDRREALPSPAMASFRAQGETILVVEDDTRVRRVSVARLLDLGYRVLEANDGPAALAVLGTHPEISVLFTDIVMPGGMAGSELATRAQQLRPEIKVLLTSGYAEPEIVRKGLPAGSFWLKKPYTAVDLAQMLRALLDRDAPRPTTFQIMEGISPPSRPA